MSDDKKGNNLEKGKVVDERKLSDRESKRPSDVKELPPSSRQNEPRIKKCRVCRKPIEKGTGQYISGCLIHKSCKELFKMTGWRYGK